jgi:hypothetical protein
LKLLGNVFSGSLGVNQLIIFGHVHPPFAFTHHNR